MARTRHSPQTRSRKVLCWALALFFAVQLGVGLLLDHVVPLYRFNQAQHVLQSLPDRPEDIDMVFLGSSRFVEGISSAEVRRVLRSQCKASESWTVLNAATLAGDQVAAEHVFGLLRKAGVRPRFLIVEVSPETLSRHTEWLNHHLLQFLRWEDLPSWAGQIWKTGLTVRTLGLRLMPLIYYRTTLLHAAGIGPDPVRRWDVIGRLAPASPADDDSSREPLDLQELLRPPDQKPSSPELQAFFEKSAQFTVPPRWLRDYRPEGRNVAALERVLSECRSLQIDVILIGIPVTTPHRQLYTPAIESAYRTCLDRLCRNYACRFVCCRDWMPDVLFYDNHHLSIEGKRSFSRMLALRVLVPRLNELVPTAERATEE